MDSEMYLPEVTLKHRTLMKIVIDLWNSDDIRLSIQSFPSDQQEHHKMWRLLEEKIENRVRAFPLPKKLQRDLLKHVFPIGYQIKCWWQRYHFDNHCLEALPAELCWTLRGRINAVETARKVFVDDEDKDLILRYKLACIYCMEDKIIELWKGLPEERRNDFYSIPEQVEEGAPTFNNSGQPIKLVKFFTPYVNSKSYEGVNAGTIKPWGRKSFHFSHYFAHGMETGNLAATRFFFERLTAQEIDSLSKHCGRIWRKLCDFGDDELIFYVLSRMNAEQQNRAIKKCYFELLHYALKWERHGFFQSIADRARDLLSREQFQTLVQTIMNNIPRRYAGDDYRQPFMLFWLANPPHYRAFVLEENFPWLVKELTNTFQVEILTMILKEASAEQKHSLIFDEFGKSICKYLILYKRWTLLKLFIHACIPSKEIMMEYQQVCVTMVEDLRLYGDLSEKEERRYPKFLQIVNDVMQEKD